MRLTTYPDAGAFLAAAEASLLRAEAKHNLILGIAGRVRDGRRYGPEAPLMLTVHEGEELAAATIRTPPHPLVLACVVERRVAIEAIVDRLSTADPACPGVNGEVEVAAAFARRWGEVTGRSAVLERRMRIYRLDEVAPPRGVPGAMRPARDDDVELLAEWFDRFHAEAVPGDPPSDSREAAKRFMASGRLVVWDHEGSVSMAGSSRGSAHSASVSAVYTPVEHRGHGYASACVAGLSQQLLDRGYAFCTLYADLTNPTSNRIYQRIGYRPVTDAASYRFEPPAEKG